MKDVIWLKGETGNVLNFRRNKQEFSYLLKGCLKIKKSNLTKGYLYKKQPFYILQVIMWIKTFS